jgi:hypothetical protein
MVRSAAAVRVALVERGITLRHGRDGRLEVHPAHLLTTEDREALITHRDALLALIVAGSAPAAATSRLPREPSTPCELCGTTNVDMGDRLAGAGSGGVALRGDVLRPPGPDAAAAVQRPHRQGAPAARGRSQRGRRPRPRDAQRAGGGGTPEARMSPALKVVLEMIGARVTTAAHAGTPLRQRTAVELLRQAGIPRSQARAVIAAEIGTLWRTARLPSARHGGRPRTVLVPLPAEVLADDQREAGELRARLLAAARAAGFRQVEIRCQVVIPSGETFWQRFVALADVADVGLALRAFGVAVYAGDVTP